jgi:hypothetical protein
MLLPAATPKALQNKEKQALAYAFHKKRPAKMPVFSSIYVNSTELRQRA